MATPPEGWRARTQEVQDAARRVVLGAWARARQDSARAGRWAGTRAGDLGTTAGLRARGRRLATELGAMLGGRRTTAVSGESSPQSGAPANWTVWLSTASAAGGHGLVLAGHALARGAHAFARRVRALARRESDGLSSVFAQPGDDIATVLGRLESAEGADVVLFVPRGVAALRTPAAWLRLAGHARRRGLNVLVVAARPEVRAYARQTGFTAARSRRGLPHAQGRLGLPRLVGSVGPSALALIAGVAALGGTVAYSLPTGRIAVAPPVEPIEASVLLQINPLAPAIDVRSRTAPSTAVVRSVRALVSAPTTGAVPVGDRPAGVRLEFRNEGESPIEVPAGTVVREPSRLGFATLEALRIEGGTTALVDAIATQPGTIGNVPPGALRILDEAPRQLMATNPAPARGGTDRLAPGVAQADVDRVQQIAEDVLGRVAVRQLREEFPDGFVLPQSVSIALLSKEPYQQLDEPTEVFVAEYVGRASLQVVLPETAREFAAAYLETLLPPGRILVPGAVTTRFAKEADDGGRTQVEVTLASSTAAVIDHEALAREVAGASPGDARAVLRERLALTSDPQVSIGPRWLPWPWLPRRASRIEFVLVGPPELKAPDAEAAAPPRQ